LLLQEFLKINIFPIKLRAENLNNKIFKWLEYNKDINEPIFMYIHYIDPHYPYIPSKKFQKFKHKTKHSINQQHIDMYDCEILYTDKQIGDLLNKLKEYNLFDNSIIIFTADHGEEFREHGGRFHSQTVYEEVVHVPCVIKFPNAEFTGKREGIFYGLDFMPTLLDYFEIPYDKNSVQGISVMNTIKNQSNSLIDREIYIENYYENKRYTIKSWRTKNWKLIINEKSPRTNIKYELYNLNNDKNEQNNVFEKYKTKAYELKKKLETKENTLNRTHESDEVKIKQSELERMKSLGYFN
jgi:arylsulfatase A-like enzyme